MPKRIESTYVIVGAGAFGASTAYHLIQKYPEADVILIDRGSYPHPAAASWDVNKVVRADYTNPLYMDLALESMRYWTTDPLYELYYHASGIAWLGGAGSIKLIVDNYRSLGASESYRLTNPEEIKTLWGGIHSETHYDGVGDILINESGGWVEATNVLEKVINTAIEAGVKYSIAHIKEVVLSEDGAAVGVRAENGDFFSAQHVILATGSYTAMLLCNSAPLREEVHAGHRLVAAGICTASVELNSEDARDLGHGPVFVHSIEDISGMSSECGAIPPNSNDKSGGRIKVYREQSFTNMFSNEDIEKHISVPPNGLDYDQRKLSSGMMAELRTTLEGIYGERSKNWSLVDGRICWDAITPTQDPIISGHSHVKNLFIVTGGSFHCFKFLPIIGKYVVQLLDDTLGLELVNIWSWDREGDGSAHKGLLPRRDMKDV
ncbi:FAD dependent oxidoreductase [Xylariales sp. PMI_506]|nr:FAD dependent oxidoreductase [Xylariales sp. PMI_506]